MASHPTIEDIVLAHDARNMTALRPFLSPTFVTDAADALLGVRGRVLIVTGFYVLRVGAPETDGPPGAAAIGRALAALGFDVTYVTDRHSRAVVASITGGAPVVEFPIADHGESALFATRLVSEQAASAVVAIERPGLLADGTYRNYLGVDFTAFNAKTDYLFHEPVLTIGIGDGGNELGMGMLSQVIPGIPGLPKEPCVTAARHLIISSCSNWGAYGLVAALSLRTERNLLPSVEAGRSWVETIVRAGAVEGLSGERKPWVDGRRPEEDDYCLQTLHAQLTRMQDRCRLRRE